MKQTDSGVMFTADGLASPLLIARWRAKGAAASLQPLAALHRGGTSTIYFRAVARQAFPSRGPLPDDVATGEGRFTDEMNVWWA